MVDNCNVNLNLCNLNKMSLPFYSDEERAICRKIHKIKGASDSVLNGEDNLELDLCVKWIIDHNFQKIAIQFPDSLLDESSDIAQELTVRVKKEIFILGDTSYGRKKKRKYAELSIHVINSSVHCNQIKRQAGRQTYFACCVDEITAEHLKADAIIHFGHACLSHNKQMPVLYVFGKCCLDVSHLVTAFKNSFPDKSIPVILYYEVNYHHIIRKIAENLKEYSNLITAELLYPNQKCKATLKENQVKIVKNQRYFILPKTRKLEDYTVFYIGSRKETLTNVMLCLNNCKFYLYNTVDQTVSDDAFNFNRFLRQRNYYIEKARDARIIGIIVGAFGVSNYICYIQRLRRAAMAANKRIFALVIGKINVAKLANFADIEVFVNIACLESTIVDCSGFYQPIITPYELEIALNMRELTDSFITDFTKLFPDDNYQVPQTRMRQETDVSLITGRTRTFGLCDTSDESSDESSALVPRDEMVISEIYNGAEGEFLSQRSWKGLEQKLGETAPADIQQGKKGIASEYEGERSVH